MITRGTVDDFNKDNNQANFVVLEIPRSCIETAYFASTLEKLYALTDTKKNIETFRGNVAFSVTGYDNDPRELPEIPEVREFFRALTEEWPHWLWFLSRNTGLLRTLMLMLILCDISSHSTEPGLVNYSVSQNDMARKLEDLLVRGNALFEMNDISQADKVDSLKSAMEELVVMGN